MQGQNTYVLLLKFHLKNRGVDKNERMTFNEMVGYVISAHHGMYDLCYYFDDAEYYGFNKFKNRINRDLDGYHYHEDIKGYALKLEKNYVIMATKI